MHVKTSIKIIAGFIAAVLLFSACDYVRYQPAPKIPFTYKPGIVYRKVLVEDYTGHKCGNCPRAAEALAAMETSTKDGFMIVPIAVHAGGYATVSGSVFPTNFQTPEGTAWDSQFNISLGAGNPNGLVNRLGYNTSGFVRTYPTWSGIAGGMDTMIADFQLTISNLFDTATKKLTTTVTSKAMKAMTGIYNVCIVLTEDSIIAEQEDYSLTVNPQINHAYLFNHVLRGSINGTWGTQVFNGNISNGQTVSKTYFNFQLASNFKPKNCHVIAFIYDASITSATQYEIKQAEIQSLF